MASNIKYKAIAFKENETWVGQCLEIDICVQASSPAELYKKLVKNILINIAVAEELGHRIEDCIQPAPQNFWAMYNKAHAPLSDSIEPRLRGRRSWFSIFKAPPKVELKFADRILNSGYGRGLVNAVAC